MFERIERFWRVIATALAFTVFGVGGLLMYLVVFPLLALCFWLSREQTARIARGLVRFAFRSFIEMMRVLGILRYEIRGIERLRPAGQLILANHPTLIDVVFLVALVRNADCVVKAAVLRNPFMRGPVRATNYLCNESGAGLIEDCLTSLRKGSNLIIFPEGTRTPVNRAVKLQRGAANVAVRGPFNITPITIRCEPLSLSKGTAWWRVPPRRMQFTLDIRDDIVVQPFIEHAGGEALAARQLTQHLHTYFFPSENTTHA